MFDLKCCRGENCYLFYVHMCFGSRVFPTTTSNNLRKKYFRENEIPLKTKITKNIPIMYLVICLQMDALQQNFLHMAKRSSENIMVHFKKIPR